MTALNRIERCMPYFFMHQARRHILLIGVVLLTGIFAYANSLHSPFQFDDFTILDRANLLSRAYSATPRQVVDLSFFLNHYIHGKSVFGFHLLNLFIHLCSAVMVYFFVITSMSALVGSISAETEDGHFIFQFVPFATALLFVCHPIQTQAVTYIVQRYTALATLFYLLSILMFIRARMFHGSGASGMRIWTAGIMSLISGLLAMRCKEISFTLPVMMIVVELFIFNGRLLRNRTFLALLSLLLLIIPVQQLYRHGFSGLHDLLFSISRSSREELTYSRIDYLLTEFRVIVTYVRLLLFPINQNLDYDYPLQKVFFTRAVIFSLVLHILMLSSATVMFFKSRVFLRDRNLVKGICLRLCSLGIVWFYVALLVESSIIPILDVIFEHRLYLPSTGFILLIVAATAMFIAGSEGNRKIAWAALAVVCLTFTTATIRRNEIWNDELRLWEDTASKSPFKPRVLNNLATYYLGRRMPEKAITPLLNALEREPASTESLNNLGQVLDQIPQLYGRYNNGLKFLTADKNVDVRSIDSWFANSRNNLGLVHEIKGDRTKALAYYEQAAVLAPQEEAPWLNIALMSAQQNNNKRAGEAFEKLKQLNIQRAKMIEPYIFRKLQDRHESN